MPRIDDAFSWDGDEDPTLDAVAADRAGGSSSPSGRAEPEAERPTTPDDADAPPASPGDSGEAEDAAVEAAAEAQAPRRMGDAALIAVGVIGGVYTLWAAGWIGTVLRMRVFAGDAMFYASAVLAIVAPAVWFLTAWVLTRRRPALIRFAWLLAGVLVLVPWPFLMLGAVGA